MLIKTYLLILNPQYKRSYSVTYFCSFEHTRGEARWINDPSLANIETWITFAIIHHIPNRLSHKALKRKICFTPTLLINMIMNPQSVLLNNSIIFTEVRCGFAWDGIAKFFRSIFCSSMAGHSNCLHFGVSTYVCHS